MISAVFIFDEHMRPRYAHWRQGIPANELIMHALRRSISEASHVLSIGILDFFDGTKALFKRSGILMMVAIADGEEEYLEFIGWIDGLHVLFGPGRIAVYDVIYYFPIIRLYTLLSLFSIHSSWNYVARELNELFIK